MVMIVGVRFKPAGKVYYFNPDGFELGEGSHVIVETARGLEFGEVTNAPCEVSEASVIKPLKKVVRIANQKDEVRHAENMKKKSGAMAICQTKIDARNLEMKLIDVEYTFDNSKIVFYFTADGRVDFRELVKDLATVFRMRIELRQVGVRDEAKMLGGIGMCGRSLCCHSWLPDFEPVSIKMAKVQGMSLNPTKISGICGRLMCCLKYENESYVELKKGMPNKGERVSTPDGKAVVVDTSILRQDVKVRLILPPDANTPEGEYNLDEEIRSYHKSEVRRTDKKRAPRQAQTPEYEEAVSEELKKLERE